MGFNARWGVLGAADVGAPHQRDRIWILAYSNSKHDALRGDGENDAETMVGRGVHTRGSISNSGSGHQEVARQSSNMANTTELQRNGGNNNAGISMGRESISKPRNSSGSEDVADSCKVGLPSPQTKQGLEMGLRLAISSLAGRWWDREPGETPRTVERGLGGMVDGMAARVDRLKAIGNGQVSEVARRAWEILSDQR